MKYVTDTSNKLCTFWLELFLLSWLHFQPLSNHYCSPMLFVFLLQKLRYCSVMTTVK